MVFEILEWMVFGRRFYFRYSTFGYWRLDQSHQINIADHYKTCLLTHSWIWLDFHSNKYLFYGPLSFFFHGSITGFPNGSSTLVFIMTYDSYLIIPLGMIVWWAASLELQNNRTARRWHNFPFFEVFTRQHPIIRCNTSKYIFLSSIKSVMIPKQASTRHIKSNMQPFNLLLCIGKPTVFLRYFVPMDFILFFSVFVAFHWMIFGLCVVEGMRMEVVMKGWLALEIPIWRDVAFLWQLIFGDNFATIEMKYFFKHHGVTTHGK